ncbi:efflux RND transporter permease subunit [Fulvimonas soli]|jgi:HAE1 family hydrophobic/amphiphilic exporter-1|uniref:HAE1 family hydrophobic/amphiphilic exporter-1 n=1 Tax=Fulvimonas soli TaxID=155197 RepID=A0A316HSW7_9GAMM|nr:efflux RND transporter permease subunit [Fulvimonas soli]PWK83509.1 HAE1 family hydrophobic/amphiphilic exporter-1 [Fulvimonas soli]TNY25513.1 acriflavine resistance protein B [Fulvimonas soli]
MNLPQLCIRRPVMTTLLMAALLVFGVVAYPRLPVNELPNVDFPTISISASLPGASPETMASAVATPIEAQLSTIAGISSMSSTSALGSTSITLTFELDRNIDAAAQDVQAAISAALRQLPKEMTTPPTFRKVNPADAPILYLAMHSATLPLSQVDNYAETELAQQLSMVDGVAQVNVYGSQKYAVRVSVDPDKLAAAGIGIDQVQAAIADANVNQPTGTLYGHRQQLAIRNDGQLQRAADYNDVVVAYRNGATVRLGDVGHADDSVQNDQVASWYNGERAIVLAIQRQPGANTVETVDRIRAVLPGFQAGLPPSVKLDVLYDRSQSIRASVDDVQFTLLLAGVLVVLVIYLFLGNLSATLIPAVALPISVIGTFGVMYALGYSLDNLSLLALTLAVGFVVDDAIVMLENIVRHMEAGESPYDAAVKGSGEIGFTIFSMTLSLIAVFIPVMFMGGIVGRLFHEFAVTISVAILISGVVAITLTPMLCSRFVKAHDHGNRNWLVGGFDRGFGAVQRGYARSLRWCMDRPRLVLAAFALSLAVTALLFVVTPKDFIPAGDTGQLRVTTEGPEDVSFDAMVARQQRLAEIAARDPNLAGYMSSVGAGGSRSTINNGSILLLLKPAGQRRLGPDGIIQELRRKFAQVEGVRTYIQNPPAIQVGGRQSKAQYQYTLQSIDLDALYDWAGKVTQAFAGLPGFQDVTNDLDLNSPSIVVQVDRDRLAPLGLTMAQVQTALGTAFGQNQISTIYGTSTQYWVIMQVERPLQNDPAVLSRLYVTSNTGALVPLDTVARFERKPQVLTVNHQGQLPAVTVSFNLAPGVSLSQAVAEIDGAMAKMGLPATISGSIQGTAQAFQDSMQGMGLLLLLAVFVIYLVLGILYESFIHPLTILSGLPAAAVGALLTLVVFRASLDLFAFVGIVMLIGIVKKNAIMMIDFALERQRVEGMKPAAAIYDACLVRFRPIMMTTMAAFAGTLPIALGLGAGAETRRPLGLAVVGGLVVSQVLTLYLTPVIYVYMDRLQQRFARPSRTGGTVAEAER